jgi:acetyl esterase/lipase
MFTDVARRGYVVASVEYRPSDVAGWPAFLLDVKAAIRYLRANAELYSIDKERVAIWGCSSGGNASLLTGVTGWTREFDDGLCPDESSAVKAAISYFGVTDVPKMFGRPRDELSTMMVPSPEDILFRTSVIDHPEAAAPGNPLNYVSEDKPCPPVLLIHGDEDGTVPFNQSVLMYEKLVSCGKQADLYKVKGAGHGMYFWTKEVMDVTLRFLDAYLK